jgi:type IV secretory pathway VirB10-like protein
VAVLTATAPQQLAEAGRERWTWKERSLLAAAVLLLLGAATLWLADPNAGPDPAGSANTGVASVPTNAVSHAAVPTSPSAPPGSHRSVDPVAPPLPAADAAASAVGLSRVQESENSMPLQAAAPKSGAADAASAVQAQAASRSPDSPRALCGKAGGYALYQCMQTQCAKRDWAQHGQCKRLRQQQSLN